MDFKLEVAKLVAKELKVKEELALKILSEPPKGMGDYALPLFVLAKELKKNPIELAKSLAVSKTFSSSKIIERVEAKGPYINFFITKASLSESVLEEILSEKKVLNKKISKLGSGKVMVEYSSPNTNKPLHVGHLRNNALGLAISNLLEATGHEVIKANLVNDRGVHICKSMLAYKLFASKRDPIKEKIKTDHFVGEMYVLFNEKLKKDSSLEEKAQEMLLAWERGDKETIALWKKMNKWAIDGMKETYNTFGTRFDEWFFESDFFEQQLGQKIIEEGLKKGIFVREDNGAIIALLEDVGLQDKVLLRGDGSSLYATNDLGLTQNKFEKFGLDKSYWVVANEQDLYFKQLFAIFEKLGRKWAKQCYHLSYGYVSLPEGKMKSREGTVVDADDLIKEVKGLALKELTYYRYKDLSASEREKRALIIALGAIKFYLLKNDARKDMVFDKETSVSFEGETGPYLLYSYARAKSILRKAKAQKIMYKHTGFGALTTDKEKELVIKLSNFSNSIERCFNELSMHFLAHNLLGIAEAFNSFYHEVPVIDSENNEQLNARLSLVEATAKVLNEGLKLMDIELLEEM